MAIRAPGETHRQDVDDGAARSDPADDLADLWEHRRALHKLSLRIVGDSATADDVVQETYLRAYRNLDKLEPRPSLMPWLATVARRRSIDELRRRNYSTPTDVPPERAAGVDSEPDQRIPAAETLAEVREALVLLNDRERRLLARRVEGCTLAELAEEDASTVSSVRSVLARARTKLRRALDSQGIELAGFASIAAGLRRLRDRLVAVAARGDAQLVSGGSGLERLGSVVAVGVAAAAITFGAGNPAGPASASGTRAHQDPATAAAPTAIADVSQASSAGPTVDTGDTASPAPSAGTQSGGPTTIHSMPSTDDLVPGGPGIERLQPPISRPDGTVLAAPVDAVCPGDCSVPAPSADETIPSGSEGAL